MSLISAKTSNNVDETGEVGWNLTLHGKDCPASPTALCSRRQFFNYLRATFPIYGTRIKIPCEGTEAIIAWHDPSLNKWNCRADSKPNTTQRMSKPLASMFQEVINLKMPE